MTASSAAGIAEAFPGSPGGGEPPVARGSLRRRGSRWRGSDAVLSVLVRVGAGCILLMMGPLVAPVSFMIEFLAAIPSIAYGTWGLFVLVPFVQRHVEPGLNAAFAHVPGLHWLHSDGLTGRDMFTGSLVLGIMILPIITAVS